MTLMTRDLGPRVERDAEGRIVGAAETLRAGLLVVGRRLREERAADIRSGRPHRRLSNVELRALLAVDEAEMRG